MSQSEMKCCVHALDHLVLTVQSIPDTIRFYTMILGMRSQAFAVADGSERWALLFGNAKINLHERGDEFDPKAHVAMPGSADLCFLTETSIQIWQKHLKSHDIQIETGPSPRTGAVGPILSLYIRDPDRNLIEISVRDLR